MIKKNKTRAPYKQKLHLRSFAKGLGFSSWVSTYVENRFTLPNVQLENAFSLALSQAFSFSCSFDKLSMDPKYEYLKNALNFAYRLEREI